MIVLLFLSRLQIPIERRMVSEENPGILIFFFLGGAGGGGMSPHVLYMAKCWCMS